MKIRINTGLVFLLTSSLFPLYSRSGLWPEAPAAEE